MAPRKSRMTRCEALFAHAIISLNFFIRSVACNTEHITGDIRLAMAFVAIYSANVRKITTTSLNLTYGALSSAPPSTVLMPITVASISQSLGVPYETMRRHIQMLEKSGLCVSDKRGVIISPSFFADEERIQVLIDTTFTNFCFFLEGLKAINFDFAKSLRSVVAQSESPFSESFSSAGRAVLRLCTDFRLQVMDIIIATYEGDFFLGLVHLAVLNANVGNFYYRLAKETERYPNYTPISIRTLAKNIGLPFETTRRYVRKLLEIGALAETPNGLVIPPQELGKQKYRKAGRRMEVETSRLLSKLNAIGVNLREFA